VDLFFDGNSGADPQEVSSAADSRLKALRNIFGNIWVLLGIAAYGVSLAVLWRNPQFGHEDAIAELIIFGIAFPLLAWVTTLRARPLAVTARRSAAETWLLFACLIVVSLYLVWGAALSELFIPLNWLASPRLKFFIVFARKLIVFVAIPFLLFRVIFGYRWRDFGLQFAGLRALAGNHLPVVLGLSAFNISWAAARRRSAAVSFRRVSWLSGCPFVLRGSSSKQVWWRNFSFALCSRRGSRRGSNRKCPASP
jgi:hypothetical protein